MPLTLSMAASHVAAKARPAVPVSRREQALCPICEGRGSSVSEPINAFFNALRSSYTETALRPLGASGFGTDNGLPIPRDIANGKRHTRKGEGIQSSPAPE
jgi:hypothetical protein